jgi:hypothetical protein
MSPQRVLPERGGRKEVLAMRKAILLILSMAFGMVFSATASAEPKGPGAFTLHLDCEGGQEFDILVPVGASFAALVEGSSGVAVLKGIDEDFDGTPEFLVPGFSVDELTACITTIEGETEPIFISYGFITPRGPR